MQKRFLNEKIHNELVPALEQLVEELPDDLVEFSEVEQVLRVRFLKLAGDMLRGWSEVAVTRISIPGCPSCGNTMRHKGLKPLTLATTLGHVQLRRPRYRCKRCKKDIYPHDQRIRFLSNGVSLVMGKVVCRMSADKPFARAAEDLQEDYGVRLCKQTVEHVAESAGKQINAIEDRRRETIQGLSPGERLSALPGATDTPGKLAVACCDGAMIHTGSKPKYLKNKADKPGWYEVRAASIAIGDPVHDGIEPRCNASEKPGPDSPGPDSPGPDSPGPDSPGRGHHFRMNVLRTRSFARFESVADVGMDMYLRACEVGFFDAPLQCFLSDGAAWLRNIAEEHFPDAIPILDWYHVTEYVCEVAALLFGQGTAQAKRWIESRKAELWAGRIGAALHAITHQRKKDDLTQQQRDALDRTTTYIDGNRDRMQYPRYRELGLPIGSGRAEGLRKTLVEGRCKQSGMRNWTPPGAEGILRLRAARHDGIFNQTWSQYFTPTA
ncbi:MAG: ISKra4 family transposase [Gemmatimonadales bacterium]|nr:ISKra4 family transposase [Gemmatimonadales bacterium]